MKWKTRKEKEKEKEKVRTIGKERTSIAGFIFYRKKGEKGKSQVCLLCYYRCLSNLLPGGRLVNTVKAAEESGSDYQDGLMEKKSGGFFSKFRLTGNK